MKMKWGEKHHIGAINWHPVSGKRPVSPSLVAGAPGRQLCLSLSNHCAWVSLLEGYTHSSEHLLWCFETLLFSDSIGEGGTVNEHHRFPLVFLLACHWGDGFHLTYSILEDASLYTNILWFEIDRNNLFFFSFLKFSVPRDTNENSSGKCLGDLPHPLGTRQSWTCHLNVSGSIYDPLPEHCLWPSKF